MVSNDAGPEKVPFRIGFEGHFDGLIEPQRIPELVKVASELATLHSINVQFLDTEGESIKIEDLLRMAGEQNLSTGPTVTRDTYVSTLTDAGISSMIAGKSWGRLARSYNDVVEKRATSALVQFTDMAGPGKEDVGLKGELFIGSLKALVDKIDGVLAAHHSKSAISRICGGDVGQVIFDAWKTFLENYEPQAS